MRTLLLAETELAGGLTALVIVTLAIIAAFATASIIASVWKLVLAHRYLKYNHQTASTGLTGGETAQKLLEGLGITDVSVKQCGFFASIFLGNSYSTFKKVIRLRKNIYSSKSLTAIALATQKVAIAQRDHEGDKKIKTRSVFMTMGYFAPFSVVPLVLIGIVIDILTAKGLGVFSLVFTAIAFVLYCASFIVLILNIPIEKRAGQTAVEFMQKTNLLTAEEIEDAKHLYKTYITMYVLDFISELLYIIWRLIQFLGKISKVATRK